jgi:pilus assembly protein FimV
LSIEVSIIFVRIRHFIFYFFLSIFLGSGGFANAIGLGELHVQSGLGQSLQANVILLGTEINEISQTCIRVKVGTTEGGFLAQATVSIIEIGKNKAIAMSTVLRLNEPAVKITVDVNCDIQLHRDFLVLLDPPEFLPAILSNSPNANIKASAQVEKTIVMSDTPTLSAAAPKTHRKSQKQKLGRQVRQQKLMAKLSEKPEKKIANIKLEKSTKDVLRLSDDTSFGPEGMKISTRLSPQLERQISENLEQIRLAQRQMAAMLRGDDLNRAPKAEVDLDQKKIEKLLFETARLKKQNTIDNAYFDEIRKNSFSRNWVIGLAFLVLASLLVILTLFMHVRRLQNAVEHSWWEQGREKKAAALRKDVGEKVDVVQASYGLDSNALGSIKNADVTHLADDISGQLDSQREERGGAPSVDENLTSENSKRHRTPTLEESNTSVFNFFTGSASSVKVEEISDITQEAEFWMSVNDPERAIEILSDQEKIIRPDSPVPWLYLLDLYRLVHDQVKYDSLRERFVDLFNAHIPEFGEVSDLENVLHLEDYAHLVDRICRAWNGNEIIPLLESLLVDDREGKRTGFELPVYRDILFLISIAYDLEKMGAIDGSKTNHLADVLGAKAPLNSSGIAEKTSNLGVIEFEVIDFKNTQK